MGLAFTTAAGGLIGAAGYTIFKGFERYQSLDAAKNRLENLNRTMTSTGRAGIDVGRVMETVTAAVTGTPFAMDQAMSLATRALSSATGPLDRFMKVATDGAAFAGRDIESIGSALLKVANTGKVSMEELQNELAGIPILPQLQKQFGVTGAEMAKMISDGKVGLNDLMTAIEATSGGLAKSAGDTIAGAMENAQTAVARIGANLLGSVFGKPTEDGNDLVEVLKTMTARLDDVNAWVTANSGRIHDMFEQGVQVAGDLAESVKWILDQLNGIGIGVDDVVKAFVAWKVIDGVTSLKGSLTSMSTLLGVGLPDAAAKGAAGISAALGRVVLPAWLGWLAANGASEWLFANDPLNALQPAPAAPNLPTNPDGTAKPGLTPSTPGIPAPKLTAEQEAVLKYMGLDPKTTAPKKIYEALGLPIPPMPPPPPTAPPGPAPAGNPILAPPGAGGDGAGGPKLPDAPVVPYDTTLPPGNAGLAPDAAVFSAESSFLDARHALAEKQARLNQLLASNQATEQDILNARNDVASEERDFQAAEMRMHEARQNQLESMTKQAKGTTSELSELGSQLDQDFGISKGLGGIVENITKFLGNLIAAPALQALGMIDKANPNQGSGIIGMLASQGAFGPQYTPGALQPSAMGPTALQPGYGAAGGNTNVNQMLALAQWASGRTDYAPASDLINGLADCSGSISDLYEVLTTGTTNSGRKFTTTNFASDAEAAKLGFLPGYQQGALNVGVNPYPGQSGHMAATLPNGVNFEGGGGTGGGAQYGGNAAGALDPQFEKQYYLPIGNSTVNGAPALNPAYGPSANTNPNLTPGWQGPTGLPSMIPGAAGQGYLGLPQGPGVGGGVAYPSQGGNSGNLVGGLALDGAMAATAGLDMLAPGAGAAAKIGIQLLNRTVGYAAQNAGILASGALETLSLGDNPRGSLGGGWLGKIVGGLAGAAPALPNLAGGQKAPMQGDQSQQGGNTYGDTNINVTAREGASGQEHGEQIASHKEAMFAPPGRQP